MHTDQKDPALFVSKMRTGQEISVLMNGCSKELGYATWCVIKRTKKGLRAISRDVINMGKKSEKFWVPIRKDQFAKNVVEMFTAEGSQINQIGAGQLVQNHNCYEGAL